MLPRKPRSGGAPLFEQLEISAEETIDFMFSRNLESQKMRRNPEITAVRNSQTETTPEENEFAPSSLDSCTNVRTGAKAGLTFIDLFAGCGGLSLGLEQSGFRPLLFSEISLHAAETYIANRRDLEIVPIGDIYNLTNADLRLMKLKWRYSGIEDIDLISGGPPCQGYSGIGHRRTFKLDKRDIPSNHLFQEMVRVVREIRPKIFLFENVKGLLNSRWEPTGKAGEIFQAVLDAFSTLEEYRIRWDLLHAKDYGVPQNRPRVIMVGLREDIVPSDLMYSVGPDSLARPGAVASGFLPAPGSLPPTLVELLSDLEDPDFLEGSSTERYIREPQTEIQLKLRTMPDARVLHAGDRLTEQEYTQHANYIREKYDYMIRNNGEIPEKFRTKKFAQRVFPKVWDKAGPNLTVTSLPEDYVHYSQPRSPTVREWARIQTFPDWYEFRGPRTTGGRRRAGDPSRDIWDRDVPRYTQIGNAVPVMLAEAIGKHLAWILGVEISTSYEYATAHGK
jgi:DNA (cytosine-5)-methyltransferase 1